MTARRFLACFVMLMASAEVAQAQDAKASLTDFTWLAGQWTGPALGGRSEEMWTRPDGGSMQGMYRLSRTARSCSMSCSR